VTHSNAINGLARAVGDTIVLMDRRQNLNGKTGVSRSGDSRVLIDFSFHGLCGISFTTLEGAYLQVSRNSAVKRFLYEQVWCCPSLQDPECRA